MIVTKLQFEKEIIAWKNDWVLFFVQCQKIAFFYLFTKREYEMEKKVKINVYFKWRKRVNFKSMLCKFHRLMLKEDD